MMNQRDNINNLEAAKEQSTSICLVCDGWMKWVSRGKRSIRVVFSGDWGHWRKRGGRGQGVAEDPSVILFCDCLNLVKIH